MKDIIIGGLVLIIALMFSHFSNQVGQLSKSVDELRWSLRNGQNSAEQDILKQLSDLNTAVKEIKNGRERLFNSINTVKTTGQEHYEDLRSKILAYYEDLRTKIQDRQIPRESPASTQLTESTTKLLEKYIAFLDTTVDLLNEPSDPDQEIISPSYAKTAPVDDEDNSCPGLLVLGVNSLNRSDVYRVELTKQYPQMENLWISATHPLQTAVAIDVDPDLGKVFFTDVAANYIYMANTDGSEPEQFLYLGKGSVADGLAVDYKIKRIFFTDTGTDIIATVQYPFKKLGDPSAIPVKGVQLDQPRDIALSIQKQVMYWSDWGHKPYIARANYDGSNVETIVKSGLRMPNGITLDFKEGKLYWADAGTHLIEVVDLDGSNRQALTYAAEVHFFDIELVGDNLYLTDWNAQNIKKVSKRGGRLSAYGQAVFIKGMGIARLC